jgi:serine/threonine protein kinase
MCLPPSICARQEGVTVNADRIVLVLVSARRISRETIFSSIRTRTGSARSPTLESRSKPVSVARLPLYSLRSLEQPIIDQAPFFASLTAEAYSDDDGTMMQGSVYCASLLSLDLFPTHMAVRSLLASMSCTIYAGMAPEIVHNQGRGYSAKVDIWSFGCVMLEMFAGQRPWEGLETLAIILKVRSPFLKLDPTRPLSFVVPSQLTLLFRDSSGTVPNLRFQQTRTCPPRPTTSSSTRPSRSRSKTARPRRKRCSMSS